MSDHLPIGTRVTAKTFFMGEREGVVAGYREDDYLVQFSGEGNPWRFGRSELTVNDPVLHVTLRPEAQP